jgi:hypothetical protein
MKITITACAGLLLMITGLVVVLGGVEVADLFTVPSANGLSPVHGGIYVLLGVSAVAAGRRP